MVSPNCRNSVYASTGMAYKFGLTIAVKKVELNKTIDPAIFECRNSASGRIANRFSVTAQLSARCRPLAGIRAEHVPGCSWRPIPDIRFISGSPNRCCPSGAGDRP